MDIHDNEILSYEVDFCNRKITFHTIHNELEKIDIIFNGVLTHLFENEIQGSILFDINQHEIEKFISDNKGLLEEKKPYCWPMDFSTLEELNVLLLKRQYSCYIISCSYGLNGWILAKEYQIKAV